MKKKKKKKKNSPFPPKNNWDRAQNSKKHSLKTFCTKLKKKKIIEKTRECHLSPDQPRTSRMLLVECGMLDAFPRRLQVAFYRRMLRVRVPYPWAKALFFKEDSG